MWELAWGLLSVFTSVWVVPWAAAVTPVQLALPQEVNYRQYVSERLSVAPFSTDPRGQVAAQVDPANAIGGDPPLRVFVTNNQTCTRKGDNLAYRITVRNYGTTAATNITIQFVHPLGTSFLSTNDLFPPELPADRVLEWHVAALPPGGFFDPPIVIVNDADLRSITIPVSVFFSGGQVLTRHVIDGPCTNQLAPFAVPTPGVPPKRPAILCHPSEAGCVETYRGLGLGLNYQRAANQSDNKGPVICDGGGCNRPELGVRFEEAIADIIPGDCRVVPDEAITTSQFHDGLNRRAKPASFYIQPLKDSGDDFRRLVLENALLGIDNVKNAREILQRIHTKHWEKQQQPIEDILNSATPDDPSPAGATNFVRSVYLKWDDEWREETEKAQEQLLEAYDALQEQRRQKFPPLATEAVTKAQEAVRRACGRENDDAGLSGLLPRVQVQYGLNLAARLTEYERMQARFADPDNAVFPQRNRAASWQQELRAALDAFDDDNPEPLKAYLISIPVRDQEGFAAAWERTYRQHQVDDEARDHTIRLQQWEVALDTPKTAATACEKENVFPPKVWTTWCESGSEPQVIIQDAPQPGRLPKLPPAPILGGQNAVIRENLVKGTPCGGAPGDPFWAADCACNCDQLIPSASSGIAFCRAERDITISTDVITTDSDGQSLSPPTGQLRRITRHDLFVDSRNECLWDGRKHEDEFL